MWDKPQSQTMFRIHSFRGYGQPKLSKPKELKGIKQAFPVSYNPSCSCQVFIKGNDVWIKHRDYFSPSLVRSEDYGKSLGQLHEKYMGKSKSKKFGYEDAWGDLLARSEAWIKLEGILLDLKGGASPVDMLATILRQQEQVHAMSPYELELGMRNNYMVRFWESVILGVKGYKE